MQSRTNSLNAPPPGTLVYNLDNDEAHQVPGGLDFLDVCIDRGIHHIKYTGLMEI